DRGDILKPAELERYLPTAGTYAALRDWLVSQGFAITLESSLRHTLFASGTVAQAAAAFQAKFGRVATKDGEFTSALTEPTLPADLAPSVRAIRGLQPHLRRHHSTSTLAPMAVPQGYLSPTLVAAYYEGPRRAERFRADHCRHLRQCPTHQRPRAILEHMRHPSIGR